MEDFGDLKDKPLDFSTKLRLVEESYLANSSVSQVAKRSNLKPATVKKYRYLISKGAPMYPRHGRPPKLDAISVQELVHKIIHLECADRITLQDLIRQEEKNTFSRRYKVPYGESRRRIMNPKTVGHWRLKILASAMF